MNSPTTSSLPLEHPRRLLATASCIEEIGRALAEIVWGVQERDGRSSYPRAWRKIGDTTQRGWWRRSGGSRWLAVVVLVLATALVGGLYAANISVSRLNGDNIDNEVGAPKTAGLVMPAVD